MNVFLIGNGFDLHYDLPTSYTCFLKVMQYLCVKLEAKESITSVFRILNDEKLKEIEIIKRCCERYGAKYDAVIDSQELHSIVTAMSTNMWFAYLSACVELNGGWVDFEREIGRVIDTIAVFLDSLVYKDDLVRFKTNGDPTSVSVWGVCVYFPVFFDKSIVTEDYRWVNIPMRYVDPKYKEEMPPLSRKFVINKKRIALELFESLRELSRALSFYLRYFVDYPVQYIAEHDDNFGDVFFHTKRWSKAYVVSFNYTHTLEYITKRWLEVKTSLPISYIHGELGKNEIVLGVNSDEKDEHDEMELSFLNFKKYYQRVYFETDASYVKLISVIRNDFSLKGYTVFVIGHSLDVTDSEVIIDCFMNAGRIIVFNYNMNESEKHIRNLITIFGKKEFDKLRLEKRLSFVPLDEMKLSAQDFAKKYLEA